MAGAERSIWLRVANGVEILSGQGRTVWNEPPAVANALRELLSVLPLTHVQIDLEALRGRCEPRAHWKTLLSREGDWTDLLRETVAATNDAIRGRAVWGLGLPGPAEVAQDLGDASERGLTKAGIQLASFLQGFREAGLSFIAVDLTAAGTPDKTVAPIFRNAQMYGWRPAAMVESAGASVAGAEVRLLMRDGLPASFWSGDATDLPGEQPILFGEIPAGIDAGAIVAAGRNLQRWKG